jgi:hypothetical protein
VLGVFHVDEIDDDDAADVAQPQLPRNGGCRFQVGFEDGFFKIAMSWLRPGQ